MGRVAGRTGVGFFVCSDSSAIIFLSFSCVRRWGGRTGVVPAADYSFRRWVKRYAQHWQSSLSVAQDFRQSVTRWPFSHERVFQ
jgi:hypothetical protein